MRANSSAQAGRNSFATVQSANIDMSSATPPRRMWANVLHSIATPNPFVEPGMEEAFLLEFRSSGRVFSCWAFGLGILLAVASVLLIGSGMSSQPSDPTSQMFRVAIVVFLGSGLFVLLRFPNWSLKRYRLVVGVPITFSVISVGAMALWKALAFSGGYSNLPIALTLAVLLSFCFLRLPVIFVAISCALSTTFLVIAIWISHPNVVEVILMYAVVTNLTGWILATQIERRERRLFIQAFALKELGATLMLRAQQADNASLQKDALIQVVAHDLRQPLGSLELQVALLKRKLLVLDASLDTEVQPIEDCVTTIRGDIERLLADAGPKRDRLGITPVNLASLLDRILHMYGVSTSRLGVDLRAMRASRDKALVISNEDALFSILGNLVNNGAKFRRGDPRRKPFVALAFTSIGQRVRLDVIDNGVGIPAQHLPLVLEPYWSAIPATSDDTEGLGLGLATVKDMVDRMPGHKLRIWSRPGVGTRVSVYLPKLISDGT